MMYSLEWDDERLEVWCYGKRLAQVPSDQAREVWCIATELARRQSWSEFGAFCAGLIYGAGAIGVPDLVEELEGRPILGGDAQPLRKVPAEAAETSNVIGFPGDRA